MINNIIISSICIIVEFTIIEIVPVINAAVCMTAIVRIYGYTVYTDYLTAVLMWWDTFTNYSIITSIIIN